MSPPFDLANRYLGIPRIRMGPSVNIADVHIVSADVLSSVSPTIRFAFPRFARASAHLVAVPKIHCVCAVVKTVKVGGTGMHQF